MKLIIMLYLILCYFIYLDTFFLCNTLKSTWKSSLKSKKANKSSRSKVAEQLSFNNRQIRKIMIKQELIKDIESRKHNRKSDSKANQNSTIKSYLFAFINPNTAETVISNINFKNEFESSNPEYKNKNYQVIYNNFVLAAKAVYINDYDQTGWSKISIETFSIVDSTQQSYLAGYLEGKIAAETIDKFYNNIDYNHKNTKGKLIKKYYLQIKDFFNNLLNEFKKNLLSPEKFLLEVSDDPEVWNKILLGWYQFTGLYEGYTSEAKEKNLTLITESEMLLLQADGEMFELLRKKII